MNVPARNFQERSMSDEKWDWPLIRKRCAAEALRILRRPYDAEEVVQEALVRAWRSRHACRTPEAPLPWCLQITRNEAFRMIGRRGHHMSSGPLEEGEGVEDQRAKRDRSRILVRVDVDRALQRLTPHERLLISLRYAHDFSHSEIAEELSIPEATARVRLHRAHKRLEALL
jgi:RNA polymerase sigma-70 factor, ECF subfamily